VLSGKSANVTWQPPANPTATNLTYKLNVISMSERAEPKLRSIQVAGSPTPFAILSDLYPGGSYELQLSVAPANASETSTTTPTSNITSTIATPTTNNTSINNSTVSPSNNGRPSDVLFGDLNANRITGTFTTKPNAPGRFIVWFRNESTLLVLWQPPYPAGIFDQYKVSIEPQDAFHSVLYVLKESEPPGPAQAAFYGLVPGREYTITVQTLSKSEISKPTSASYRTVPLAPANVTVDVEQLSTQSIGISWQPPQALTEFDRYQVALNVRNTTPKIVNKNDARKVRFFEHLLPGRTYEVVVKTLSGNVASWPLLRNVTTRPLPVQNLNSRLTAKNQIELKWIASNESVQDSFLVRYHELDALHADGTVQVVKDNRVLLQNLLYGRNYSIVVYATSAGVPSNESVTWEATRPAPPVIEVLESVSNASLNVSWKADVTSRQDEYFVIWSCLDRNTVEQTSTKNDWILLQNLLPGATYTINVSAISNGLRSEPHSYVQTLFPKPPEALQVVKATNSSVILTWQAPTESLLDAYVMRYRPIGSSVWRELPLFNGTSNEIRELTAGEKYVFKVNSMSNKVESPDDRIIEQTLYPNAIEGVTHDVHSNNVTFRLATPVGRVDYFIIVYGPAGPGAVQSSKHVPIKPKETFQADHVPAAIENLQPGELYSFRLYAVSHNLRSEGVSLLLRTHPVISSVINIVTYEQETKTLGIKFTPTPRRSSVFDRYRFQLTSDPTIPAQEKLANDSHRLVLFDNLTPGRLYNLNIWTVSGGVYSSPIVRETRLYPDPIRSLIALHVTHCEITLAWQPPTGQFDGYEITYLHPYQPNRLIRNFTHDARFAYKDLRPHQNYTFEVLTVAGRASSTMLRSTPVSRTFTTLESAPGRVQHFRSTAVKPNQITFEWVMPPTLHNGQLTGFKITYQQKDVGSLWSRNVSGDHEPTNHDGLDTLGAENGSNDAHLFNYHESFVGGKAQVQPIHGAQSGSFDQLANRAVIAYKLFDSAANQGTIVGLVSGSPYLFTIQAFTRVGGGPITTFEQQMPIWPPPKPAASIWPASVAKSSSTLKIRFRKNFFSNTHGPVLAYAVIVAEAPATLSESSFVGKESPLENLPLTLQTWTDVHKQNHWPPFQTSDAFNPFENGQTTVDYTIGSDVFCKSAAHSTTVGSESDLIAPGAGQGHETTGRDTTLPASYAQIHNSSSKYCNGPLRAGRSYLVKVRAFTSPSKYTDTTFSLPMATDPDSGAMLLALLLPLSVFLLLGAIITLLRQRRLRPLLALATGTRKPVHALKGRGDDNLLPVGLHLTGGALSGKQQAIDLNGVAGVGTMMIGGVGGSGGSGGALFINSASEAQLLASKTIKLINFGDHFRRMSADSDFRFSEEFEQLRHVGRERPTAAAELPVNRPKNRFTNILPYDHSRVKLQPTDDEEGSDYINSNYIAGAHGPREYIVTQGPLHSTRDDFWRQTWEQNCKAIVMLTRCVEKGREKCDHYWPFNSQPALYGDIQVTLLNETALAHWTVSEFRLARADQPQRLIRHFHFTSWPDFGVPEPPHVLVRFVRCFRERVSLDPNRPVVVHCSAGVGRSGTFIAIDRLLAELRHQEAINVFQLVYEMRKDRVWMVQNEVLVDNPFRLFDPFRSFISI
jgi:protein tyrosine phosphatase